MALNHYVTLGRSGLRVSPICLGAMTFGPDWGWGSSIADSGRVIDIYLDRGGNFIDTANIYTRGHSEKILGDHLGKVPSKRDRTVIATKFMGNLFTGDPNGGGAGRKSLIDACEHSLRRLQTDYIDLFWMHFHDRHTPIEETMRALDDLVRAGKLRYVGFSDTPAWVCARAQTLAELNDWSPLIALQIEYSLLERTVEWDLIPMARSLGLGVTPWSPLKGGVLSGKYTREHAKTASVEGVDTGNRGAWVTNHLSERAFAIVDALRAIGQQVHAPGSDSPATPSQVALAWVLSRQGVAPATVQSSSVQGSAGGSVIIGARTLAQLDDNLAALDIHLLPEQLHALDEVSQPIVEPGRAAFPHAFLPFTVNVAQGATNINGVPSEPWPMAPKSDAERW